MTYIDAFIAPVQTDKKEAYLQHAKDTGAVFMKHGALSIMETWGADIPIGKTTDFFKAVQAETGENIVLSWVVWPNKDIRDTAMPKIFEEFQTMDDIGDMPFDGKRLIMGSFETILTL